MYPAFTSTSQVHPITNTILGLAGAAVGGTAGYFLTGWLAQQGFYALILPGALLGLGCGGFIRRRSIPLAMLCGVAALLLGGAVEWQHHPFIQDKSLDYFLSHLGAFQPITYIMLAAGTLAGFWFALGGESKAVARASMKATEGEARSAPPPGPIP